MFSAVMRASAGVSRVRGLLVGLVLLVCACGTDDPAAVAADPFSGLAPVGIGAEKVEQALERFYFEYSLARSGQGLASISDPNLRLFAGVFNQVLVKHVDPGDPTSLVNDAVTGLREAILDQDDSADVTLVEAALDRMLSALDPYSAYLNPEEFRNLQAHTTGEFGGLGLEITLDQETELVRVVTPIDSTPAARAGVKAGDLITHIDGTSIRGWSLLRSVARMRGAPGTSIRLTVQRAGTPRPLSVRIRRAIINIDPVRFHLDDASAGPVGYIRITAFNEKTVEEIDHAIDEFDRVAGAGLRGLVLDLRNNPGGLLDQSVGVAGRFLEPGLKVVAVRGRAPGDGQAYFAAGADRVAGVPMVVLINSGSASASEIVAAALQDHRRALLFGSQSYGKGSVQTVAPLGHGDALRLTTAYYYRPSGGRVECFGVAPNLVLEAAAPDGLAAEPRDETPDCGASATPPPAVNRFGPDWLCPAEAALLAAQRDEEDGVLSCALEALRGTLEARR